MIIQWLTKLHDKHFGSDADDLARAREQAQANHDATQDRARRVEKTARWWEHEASENHFAARIRTALTQEAK